MARNVTSKVQDVITKSPSLSDQNLPSLLLDSHLVDTIRRHILRNMARGLTRQLDYAVFEFFLHQLSTLGRSPVQALIRRRTLHTWLILCVNAMRGFPTLPVPCLAGLAVDVSQIQTY